ncbi:hypothetical protein KP509_07G036100 [Ceratopteris richardii]|uniref:indole-3-glycerol-phosphate synthase n=1 Tax=Ceratopteris richardii TaxID=49495 RepID=A0A8T2UH97_CERRI|nr:hypothetical protein KP509_07G036100 [Ceratopteris richardii]
MEALSAFMGPGYATTKTVYSYQNHRMMTMKSTRSSYVKFYCPCSKNYLRSFHIKHVNTSTNEDADEAEENNDKKHDKALNMEPFESQFTGEVPNPENVIPISSSDSTLFTPPAEWKGWQEKRKEEEMLAREGISIRRRPPTGPPLHYVGPFEFRIQNEGNTPRNKLEEIIWNKDVEVTQMKERMPLRSILQALPSAPPPRDFICALQKRGADTNMPALIAEVKKASPSRGVIQPNFDPVRIAQAYEKGGAACISILTDSKYFQGDFEYLKRVRNAGVQCPLLCKEFIIDAWQIYFARLHGADAVLLIAAVLPNQDLKYMSKICKKLGMTALVEVHNEQEMDRVLGIDGIDLIGINNRDLGMILTTLLQLSSACMCECGELTVSFVSLEEKDETI